MIDLIVGGIILLIVGGAVWYVVKAKKTGAKCIGCPAGSHCPSKGKTPEKEHHCNCGCGK